MHDLGWADVWLILFGCEAFDVHGLGWAIVWQYSLLVMQSMCMAWVRLLTYNISGC